MSSFGAPASVSSDPLLRLYSEVFLFERSEFLIATSPPKTLYFVRVACVRLILVLVWGRQTVYGQNTVYLCLSKYIVWV